MRVKGITLTALLVSALSAPLFVFGHEVYVLTSEEIAQAYTMPPANPVAIILDNLSQFLFWAFVVAVVVTTFFFMSLSRRLERLLHPFFLQARQYAPLLIRLGTGATLIAFAFAHSLFGPEIPLERAYGPFADLVSVVLGLMGVMLLTNVYVRLAAAVGLFLFIVAALTVGWYLTTYVEYAAVFLFLLIGGVNEPFPRFRLHALRGLAQRLDALRPYRFAIARVGFGISVMFASLYAKIFYSPLAFAVVEKYDLTQYSMFSSFEPNFFVLGAALIEFLCGILIVLGIEIRHTAAFLAFWLTLSLAYFQEMVWPHIILFGLGGAFLLYGYDQYSLEGRFFKKGKREPVL